MRRADFSRREQTRRRRVAHCPKLSQDGFKPEGEVTGDVLKEHPFWTAFADDPGDLGPEVAGVINAAALSGHAERLAGIARENGVDQSTPRAS